MKPVIVAVLVHLALVGLHVAKQGGDVSALVGVSDGRLGQAPYENVTQSIGPGGYDGMFYYAIAQSPWQRHIQGIDAPAARHLRVLYSVLCWAISGGDGRLLLWVMPAVNLAIIAALTYLASGFAVAAGRSAWWGLGLTLAVNAAIPAMRDLTDCLSTLAVCGLLIAWLTGRSSTSIILWAAAAIFSREQNLAVLVLLAGAALTTARPAACLGLVAVLAVWAGWVGLLGWAYGSWPFLPSHGNFATAPFGGLAYGWSHLGGPCGSTRLALCNATSLAHWSAMLVAGSYLAWRVPNRVLAGFLAVALLLAVTAGPSIYEDLMSYRRVLVWLPLGIWLTGLRTGSTWPLMLLTPAPLWSVAAALKYV